METSTLEAIGKRTETFIDCYVSTDVGEFEEFLVQLGFGDQIGEPKDRSELWPEYEHIQFVYSVSLQSPRSGLQAEIVDTPLEEAVRVSKFAGFVPQCKARFYRMRNSEIHSALLPVAKRLEEERQNYALVDETGRRSAVYLSPYFVEGILD